MFKLALWFISREMKRDSDLAWSWHCNIAMTAVEAGAQPAAANMRTADFMKRAFGVDTFRHYMERK